jgi:hypothetical protein
MIFGKNSGDFREWQRQVKATFDRHSSKANFGAAKNWFSENHERVTQLFGDERVTDYVFRSFTDLFRSFQDTTEGQVKTAITQVALANAVLAGLPGKLGVGVYVCMALEAWMAMRIAGFVGVKLKSSSDIFKYVGVIGGVAVTIGWLFTHLLRGAFSLLSLIPVNIPITVLSELFVTDLIGIMFWFAFKEAADQKSFRVPVRMLGQVYRSTSELLSFQINAVKQVISLENIRETGERLWAWLKGDITIPDPARLRGEVCVVAMFALLQRHQYSELEGPLGEIFFQSIRDRWSRELSEASIEDIAHYMDRYDSEQMLGVISVIKGKMFEHMIGLHENTDGDVWSARLHTDESYPGSDIIFSNMESGQEVEVSLKAVSDPALIERALMRYPDIPILTTSEMSEEFVDIEMVLATELSDEELQRATENLFDDMMEANSTAASHLDTAMGVGIGTTAAMTASLWPYVAAYLRGRITREELNQAFRHALGETGDDLAARIALAAVFGPVYAWYLLAKGVMQIVPTDEGQAVAVLRLEYTGKLSSSKPAL